MTPHPRSTGTIELADRSGPRGTDADVRPLNGIRVIELGSVVAGPFATPLLADYGADVIKVEAPDRPEPLRHWGQEAYREHHLWWTAHARNKRCVTPNLRSERGQELLLELLQTADVIVENFRRGTLEKWHLDYASLSAQNQGLVVARVSGFGQTGPYSERRGYASIAEAMGGLRAINGYPRQAPPRMAISLGDSLGGLFAVIGILAALQPLVPEDDRLGRIRRPSGTRLDEIAPSNLFKESTTTPVRRLDVLFFLLPRRVVPPAGNYARIGTTPCFWLRSDGDRMLRRSGCVEMAGGLVP